MNERPWLAHYESRVPARINYPDLILPGALRQTAIAYPDKVAIIFMGMRITYAELDRNVDRLVAALQQIGVSKGDRVAVQLPNCPEFVIAYYAILRMGGIAVPCDPLYQISEMVDRLSDSSAKAIFTLSNTYPMIKKIRTRTQLHHIIVAQIRMCFPPSLRDALRLFWDKNVASLIHIRGDIGTTWFGETIRNGPPGAEELQLAAEDTAILIYTGGRNGRLKGAELTHRNILANAYMCKIWLNLADGKEINFPQVPLFQPIGMTLGMNLSVLTAGTLVLVPNQNDIRSILLAIDEFKPTIFHGVPAIFNDILHDPDVNSYDLRSLKRCVSFGGPLSKKTQEAFEQLTETELVEGYGLSEASPVTHMNPFGGGSRLDTIGLPLPDTDARIVDGETGTEILRPGEKGELCVRGPQVMKGYWNMREETMQVLRADPADPNPQPWLHTGDVAAMDTDGFFRIVDRLKEVIVTSQGYAIYPREIEFALYQHPAVLEAAVIGVPDENNSMYVKAIVVLKPGMHASVQKIIKHCKKYLAPYKVPKLIEFRDSLPKTMIGKVLRRQLLLESLGKGDSEGDANAS